MIGVRIACTTWARLERIAGTDVILHRASTSGYTCWSYSIESYCVSVAAGAVVCAPRPPWMLEAVQLDFLGMHLRYFH